MTNPIIAEIARVAPDVVLTGQQIRAAERAKNPDAVAASIGMQFASIKRMFSEKLGLSDIPDDDIVRRMILTTAVTSLEGMPANWLLEFHTPIEVFQLGQSALDPVRVMYQVILGREPDDAGYAFWNGHYQDGIPLSKLCGFMEREVASWT